MSYKHWFAALMLAAACGAVSGASAAVPNWPGRIVGTWKGLSDQVSVVITVAQQTGTGGCQNITGTMQNAGGGVITSLIGYYCPKSGAVEFLRLQPGGNAAFQVYSGSINQINAGAAYSFIAGSFSSYALADGPLGQYSFSLSR